MYSCILHGKKHNHKNYLTGRLFLGFIQIWSNVNIYYMRCLIPQSRLMTVKQKHYFFLKLSLTHSLTLSQGHTPSSCSEDCNVKLWCKVPLEPVLILSHREKQHQHLKSMEVPFRKHSLFGQLGEKPSMENGGDLKRWYFTCIMIIRK